MTDTDMTPEIEVQSNAHEWEPDAAKEYYSAQDLTAPEAVERYNPIAVAPHDVDPYGAMETDPDGGFVQHEDYAALSAALESEKSHKRAIAGDKIDAVSELRQVKARLKEGAAILDRAVNGVWRDGDLELARAFLASLEVDKP